MQRRKILSVSFVIVLIIVLPTASAHVPLEPGDNHSLEEAYEVVEPTKSWALYDHLHEGGEAAYYKFDLNAGEKVYAMVYTPEEGSFAPGLVVMGPGIELNDTAPDYVELVEGVGRVVVYGERNAEAEFEPFTPSSYYYTAEYEQVVDVPGTYYVAVFENDTGGHFGVAIGYIESFTLSEWLGVPLDVIKIHMWEGQSIMLILAPMIVLVVVGLLQFFLIQWKTGKGPKMLSHRLAFFAALMFFGSAAMTLMQMMIALGRGPGGDLLWVTLVFAAVPIILGLGVVLNSVLKPDELGMRKRVLMVVLGVLALTFWAGLYLGPILLIAAAFIPMRFQGRKAEVPEKEEKDKETEEPEQENVVEK